MLQAPLRVHLKVPLVALVSCWFPNTVPGACAGGEGTRVTAASGLFLLSSGRILDLKTGTVKKEGQQSMRMCMGSRRSFICRMR